MQHTCYWSLMETTAKSEFRWKLLASTAMVALILLAVCVQAVHIHTQSEPAGAICMACVSAHTAAPVAALASSVLLIAITLALVLHEFEVPSCESVLPLFIRPPPSR